MDARKSDLTENLNRLLESKKAEINSLESLIESDAERIEIRKGLPPKLNQQYDNGTDNSH